MAEMAGLRQPARGIFFRRWRMSQVANFIQFMRSTQATFLRNSPTCNFYELDKANFGQQQLFAKRE
jgi:erythromycin esterase-like protein